MSRQHHSTAFIRNRQRCARVRGTTCSTGSSFAFTNGYIAPADDDEDMPELGLTPIDTSATFGPQLIRSALCSERRLLLALLGFRLANAALLQTQFVPDEHWQSVEVAHRMAFGYGYYTWEWRVAIRSALYPMLFAIWFKLLSVAGLDHRVIVMRTPRFWQAVLAAVADLHLYKFSRRVSGQSVAQWSLFLQICSWFTFYTAARTLTNSLEWALTSVALAYYPWPEPVARRAQWKFCLVVAICVLLRPTAAVQWLPLCLWHVWRYRDRWRRLLAMYTTVGLFCLGVSLVVDKYFYGRWILVQYNFFSFNLFADVASLYGVHPWHWYFTQGLPVIFATHLPLVIYGAWLHWNKPVEGSLIIVLVWTVYIYSFLAHKEFRFLFPLLPMGMHLGGMALAHCSTANWWPRVRAWLLVVLLTINIPAAMYTSLLHQRGVVDVVNWLGREASNLPRFNRQDTERGLDEMRVLFLTPCHSTPYYSHVHVNISMRFLTCEPNLEEKANYTEEQDEFYSNPTRWLSVQYPAEKARPTHVIMFESLRPVLNKFLSRWHLRPCRRFFHAHVTQGRQSSYLLAYCGQPPRPPDKRYGHRGR